MRHEEDRTFVQDLTNQSLDIADDIAWESSDSQGDLSVADLLSPALEIALGRHMFSAIEEATKNPQKTRALLNISRELSRQRDADHSLARLRIERERQEAEKRAERKKFWDETRRLEAAAEARCKLTERIYAEKKKEGSLTPEEEAYYQERFKEIAKFREGLKLAELHDKHMWAELVV